MAGSDWGALVVVPSVVGCADDVDDLGRSALLAERRGGGGGRVAEFALEVDNADEDDAGRARGSVWNRVVRVR